MPKNLDTDFQSGDYFLVVGAEFQRSNFRSNSRANPSHWLAGFSQRQDSVDQQCGGVPGISYIRDQAFEMSAHRLEIQIEDLQKHLSFGAERVVKLARPTPIEPSNSGMLVPSKPCCQNVSSASFRNIVRIKLFASHALN